MINLILVSHGSFAAGIREAAEMIFGEQDKLEVFGVFPGDTVDSFSAKIEKAIQNFGDPSNTLILSDLTGGTPCNTAIMMVLKHHVKAMSGLNLPMLIEILSLRDEAPIDEIIAEASKVGKEGIVTADELISA